MKHLLITAAMAISLLTLLAACGGDGSTVDEAPNQETAQRTTGFGTPIDTTDTGKSNVVRLSNDAIVDLDGQVQLYLALMDDLAKALRSHNTNDLSDEALQPIRFITSRLESFSLFFNALDEEDRSYLFGKYGGDLQQSAERVASYALIAQQSRGDEVIAQELALLPAFAIATTNTSTRTGTATEPITGAVQVPGRRHQHLADG